MFSLLMSFFMVLTPFAQQSNESPFDIRARQNLLMGKGATTGTEYWDVIITRQPSSGVLIKLPYTRKGGKFTFDLHHRLAITDDFGLPAQVTTVIEILSGGTNSHGAYTIVDTINQGDKFDENIVKTSTADIDRFVTPMSRKTITLSTLAGPQSISIVGQTLTITRGATTTRIDTPGTRIAAVSNFKFEAAAESNPLTLSGTR
jgi:hypothetical protein